MENQYRLKLKKVSRLFPSSFTSCQFRTLPDVADTNLKKIPHENDRSTFFFDKPRKQKTHINKLCKTDPLLGYSSGSVTKPKKMEKNFNYHHEQQQCCAKSGLLFNQSSSSNSGWFTNDDDGDTFFSLSSNSGDSFRLKTSRRFRGCEEMKSIDETGRRSFSSSLASVDTVPCKCSSRRLTATAAAAARPATAKGVETRRENEPGSDYFSTQLYYNNNNKRSDPPASLRRRRRAPKNCRKAKKRPSRRSFHGGAGAIEESRAVEMSSSDPRGDFRESMVEMIVEKQIFAAEDLQRLLLCFLSLNEAAYHGIIFDVFNEICQTLFTN